MVFVPEKKRDYRSSRCYLSGRGGCSKKISQEHIVSACVLGEISKQNSTIIVKGVPWLPKGVQKSIGKAGLTSGVLCDRHNSVLSGLDAEAAHFFASVEKMNDFCVNASGACTVKLNGIFLERWLVKTVMGMVSSSWCKPKGGHEKYSYSKKLMAWLCSSYHPIPQGWGVYFSFSYTFMHSSSFEVMPVYDDRNGEVVAVEFVIRGLKVVLVMCAPGVTYNVNGVKRPAELIFSSQLGVSKVILSWGGKKSSASMTYKYVGRVA